MKNALAAGPPAVGPRRREEACAHTRSPAGPRVSSLDTRRDPHPGATGAETSLIAPRDRQPKESPVRFWPPASPEGRGGGGVGREVGGGDSL